MKKSALKKLGSYNPSGNSGKLVKIGEASEVLGISIDTLRRWEKKGWLKITKTPGGTRLYDKEQLQKLNPNLKRGPKSLLTPLAPISQLPQTSYLPSAGNHQTDSIQLLTDQSILKTVSGLSPETFDDIQIEKPQSIYILSSLVYPFKKFNFNITTTLLSLILISILALPAIFISKHINKDSPGLKQGRGILILADKLENNPVVKTKQLAHTLTNFFSPPLSRRIFGIEPPGNLHGNLSENSNNPLLPASKRDLSNLKGLNNLGSVLAESSPSGSFLEINLDTVVNGLISAEEASISGILSVSNVAYNFPDVQGAASTFLQDDGNGNLAWTNVPQPGVATTTSTGIASFSSSFFTVSTAGAVSIIDGGITTTQIKDGTISNSDLASSSITISPGSGMSGGGAVSLGGSITLTNAGVTSITGTSNQVIASASTGGVTLTLPQSIATSSTPTFAGLLLTGSTSGTLTLNAAAATTSYTLTFPADDGTNNYVLSTNGSGTTSWQAVGGGACGNCVLTDPASTQTITPTATGAIGLSVAQASGGTVDIFNVTNNGGSTKYFQVNSTGNAIFNSNNVGIGITAPTVALDVGGSTFDRARIQTTRYSTDAGTSFVWLRKARGTAAVPAAVESGDPLGTVGFIGYNAGDFQDAGYIAVTAEAAPGATYIPTYMTFSTGTSTAAPSEKVRIASDGNVGINDISPNAYLDVDSTRTTGLDFLITNTGVGTSGSVAQITANSYTTGDLLTLSGTALSTGSLAVLTGPSGGTAGVTDAALKITSDVGNIGTSNGLISSTAVFDGSAATGVNLYLTSSDAIAAANTDYGIYNTVSNTGAIDSAITKTSYGSYTSVSSTGGGPTTAGTTNVYGQYITTTATHAAAFGTVNQYGLYIADGTSSGNGTSTKYGLYIEDQTGADVNVDLNFTASPIVRIGDAGVLTFTEAGGNNTLCTITDASNVGNLSCTGNITGSSSGTVGFWTRTSTTLSPATANDVVSISSNDTTNPVLTLTSTGASANAALITGNSTTTGNVLGITANGLTTGNILSLTSSSTAAASNTQTGLNIALSGTNGTAGQTTYGMQVSNTHDGATSTNIGGSFTATGGTTANTAINVASITTSSGSNRSILLGSLTGGTTLNYHIMAGSITAIDGAANYYLSLGHITGGGATATNGVIDTGNISATGGTNFGIRLGTLTGGSSVNYQITTGALTSATTTTNAQLNLGGIVTTGGTTNYGINIGALSGSGTTNYGINIANSTATGTTNYGIKVGTISGAASGTNYGLYVDTISGAAANYAAVFAGGNVGIGITAPAAQLDVLATAASTGINLAGTAPASVAGNGTSAATNTLAVVGTAGGASSGTTGQTGGTGGTLSLTGGIGGAVAGASGIGGVGGAVSLTGGAGGNGAATGGAGGGITFTTGNAGTGGNANAGTLSLQVGTITGSGTAAINIGTTSTAKTINIAGTGATGADTINIGTGGTGADTITIGNNASTTSLALTSGTGSQTFTSSVISGTTTTSAFVFNGSALTSGTGLYITSSSTSGKLIDVNATNTSGTIFNLAYGASTTLAGDTTGFFIDLNSGNVVATNQNLTGVNFKIPTVTNTITSGTKTLTGMLVNFGSGSGINQNGAGGTTEFIGGDFQMPALTETAGTLNAYGVKVTTPSSFTTGGTAYGVYVNATKDDAAAGGLSGLYISKSAAGSSTAEYAVNVANTTWDAVLRVGSTTVINGSGVTQVVGGGTGLATVTQNGVLYGNTTSTLGVTAEGATGQVLIGTTGGAPSWGTISGSTCTNCLISNPSSDQSIAPTGQGTTGLIVKQTSTASPTDDIFQITDSAGSTKYFYVDKDGNVSTGAIANTTLTLTPTSNTTALTLVGTNVTSAKNQYINTKNSSGTISDISYGAAQTLAGTITGHNLDLSTNVTATNQSASGYVVTLPAATNTSGTQNYKGLVVTGGAINENGGTATNFYGADITIPALTQTSGTLTAYGIQIDTPSSITTGGTAYGLQINAEGVGAGTLIGLDIDPITAGAGTETGLQIGTGWDTNLLFNDTTTRVAVADGGTITILDSAGNSLCTITDSGSVGDLSCSGTIGGTGTVGFWSRTSTTLTPSNANDIVSIPTTNTTGADLAITNTGVYTGTGIVNLTADSATAGTLLALSADGLTTGKGIDLTSTSNAWDSGTLLNVASSQTAATDTTLSADTANISFSPTYSTAVTTPAISGNVLDISRSSTTNSSFASTLTVSGALVSLSDSATQTTGTLTHTASVLDLTQNYTSSTGTTLYVKSYGGDTGYAFRADDASGDTTPFVIENTGEVGIGTTAPGAALEVTGNILLTKEAARTISVGDSTTSNTAGAALTIQGAAGAATNAAGGAINVTGGTGAGSGNGGALVLTGGSNASTGNGGGVSVTAGSATTGTGDGGLLTLAGGAGGSAGGTHDGGGITITTGNSGSNGTAGSINMNVGTSAGSGNGLINIGTAARNQTITIGNTTSTKTITFDSGVATGTTTTSAVALNANALTSGTGLFATSTSITSGKLLDLTTGTANTWTGNGTTNGLINIASSSTAGTGSSSDILLNIARSGANANSTHTAYGIYSSVTNTGTGAVNVAGYFSANGSGVTNYAGIFANGNVGIGTTTPGTLLDVAGRATITSAGNIVHDLNNATAVIFNEQQSDIDFRIESDNIATMLGVDAGNDTVFIGTNPGTSNHTVYISRTKTLAGSAGQFGTDFVTESELTLAADMTAAGIYMDTRFTEAGSGTHALVTGLYLTGVLNNGVGATTTTAQLYIPNAMSNGASNYAIFVDSGISRFDGNVGIGTDTSPDNILDIETADSTADIVTITGTSITSGQALQIDGSTSTGVTAAFTQISTDVGAAGALLKLVPDFSGSSATGYGLWLAATDATNNANTDRGAYITLTMTGNAANYGAAIETSLSTTSTTGNETYGGYFQVSNSGVLGSGTKSLTGVRGKATSTNTNGGDSATYGGYFEGIGDSAAGTQTAYGVYGAASGADNNYPFYMGTAPRSSGTAALCWDNSADSPIDDCSGAPVQDYAEIYSVEQGIEYGEIVTTGGNFYDNTTFETDNLGNILPGRIDKLSKLNRSNRPYQDNIIGITSQNWADFTSTGHGSVKPEDNPMPIALNGRVSVKVSTENGPIQRGDYLTSSSIPGVAMRATRPGQVLGKALADYSESGIGKIVIFVNVSFADPSNALANLIIDNNGALVVPEVKAEKLVVSDSLVVHGSLKANSVSIDASSLNLTGSLASVTPDSEGKVSIAEALNAISDQQSAISNQVLGLESASVSQSTQIAQTSQIAQQAVAQAQSLDEKVASTSANLASLSQQIQDLLNQTPSDPEPGLPDLTPPDLLSSTGSATLANLNVTEKISTLNLEALDATVSATFKSLGQSFLGNTTIAGDLSVDGTFSVTEGNSINAFPALFLQNNPLAEAVDIFRGKVKINKEGLVEAESLALGNQSVGEAVIAAGQTEVTIPTSIIKADSKIFLTATSEITGNLFISQITDGSGFKIKLSVPNPSEVRFNWMIVGTKKASN